MGVIDLEKEYTPRNWAVYELEIGVEYRTLRELLTSTEETGLKSCGSSSQVAIDHFERTGSIEGLFFFDTEQVFMDLDDVVYGQMALGKLTQEWRGHPAGSLVFAVTKGVDEGKFTIGVEKVS